MNIYALIHGINAIAALAAASIILFSKSRKPAHLGHGWFSLLLFLYTFPYFLWGIQSNPKPAVLFILLLLHAVCFIHVAYFHYALILSDKVQKYKSWLVLGYITSFILAIANHSFLLFDIKNIRPRGPFLFWPHATPYLSILIFIQCSYVLFSWAILWQAMRKDSHQKINLKNYLIMGIVGWIGGLSNWFSFWNGPFIPPVGNAGVMLLTVGTFYLIFKHDFLEIDKNVKKAFVYTLLTLSVTMIYTAFVLIGEKLSSGYFGYTSLITSLLAAMTITFLFNPLKSLLDQSIDRLAFGKDISKLSHENIQFQSEIKKQDHLKAIALLASGMAHEIKNPLAAIRTFTEYLPKKYEDPEFRARYQKVVLGEVARMDSIVRQLLDFSKPQEPRLEPQNLNDLLAETLEPLSGDLLKSNISLRKEFGEAGMVLADKNQLKQVFLNLFLNSIQAMPDGGILSVVTQTSREGVAVSIIDSGCGMSKEALANAFEPFFTTKSSGTGLGLSIVKGILESHNASIGIESQMGVGTRIIVNFRSFGTP